MTAARIVFFDGHCALCDGFVGFVARRDTKGLFAFAPLQGETAKKSLPPEAITDLSTIYFKDENGLYTHSGAALRVLRQLPNWRWIGAFLLVPRIVRDAVYRLVARHRYRLFGRKDTCDITAVRGVNRLP